MPVPSIAVCIIILSESSHCRAKEVDLFFVVRDASLNDRVFHILKILRTFIFVKKKDRAIIFPFKVSAFPWSYHTLRMIVALSANVHARRIVEFQESPESFWCIHSAQVSAIYFDWRGSMYHEHEWPFVTIKIRKNPLEVKRVFLSHP